MLQHDSMPDSPTPKSPASSPPPTSPSSDDVERCVYPSKFCPNPRATKMNGERHKFCEFHRRKANLNQRRWQQRRQRQRKDHLVALTPSRSVNEHGVSGGAYSDDDAAHPQSPDGAASASASASVRQLPATIGVSASPEEVTSSTKQFMF
ncbi:hypothetical protein P43SY_007607 [Pythium insidiosum]|uniref:Uncharacterized protein n=1 Tax=Pythium insidiosum TaxID=114742 RepID=A0AAD5LKI7_PYTIN|nr:hypothetical protein P43SY_007607 [Pythium insidiosum]